MNKTTGTSLEKKDILAKNTFINLLGQGIPLLFAVGAIPFVIDGLGTERFGVLTIVWVVIGYFGLFDMGVGRATTKFVADFEAKGEQTLSPIILTSMLLLIGFGLLGGILVVILTPWIVNSILNVPATLIPETINAFYVLSISIPLVLGSIGARGALEAQQKFSVVNVVKIPASIVNYLAPLLILPFSNSLQHIVIVLVAGRAITFMVYGYFCFKDDFSTNIADYPVVNWIKDLLSFGAWITVSNFISPLMVYMDRFIIGAILTMSAVAYYTTPYEVVTRLFIISGSFMGVMFPAFSVYSLENEGKLTSLYKKSIRYLLFAVIPPVAFLVLASEPILLVWLGEEFAQNSAAVVRLLAAGVLANAVAMVPYTALQAMGRPDITAKLHMAELPLYLLMILYFTKTMGIEGVALAWALRVAVDGLLLLYFFNRIVSYREMRWSEILKKTVVFGTIFSVMAWILQYIESTYPALLYASFCTCLWIFILWNWMLKKEEREKLFNLLSNAKTLLK